jgi:hypothetical protein
LPFPRTSRSWRVAFGAVALAGVGLAAPSCMRRANGPETQLQESSAGAVAGAARVFKKLIGRDPAPSEIAPLQNLPYPELVKRVLASPQFEKEGFYNLQRERFLLNREGTRTWLTNSYDDYCSLRLEMADEAAKDKAGNYFDLLTYRDRWIPVADTGVNECFFGTNVALLLEVRALGEDVDYNTLDQKQKLARRCLQNLPWSMAGDNADADPQQLFDQFMTELAALPDADKQKSLLELAPGEALFTRMMRDTLFPAWSSDYPETAATQPADMKIQLVKENGKLVLAQELGTSAIGQCRFKALDPVTWEPRVRPDDGFPGDGGGPIFALDAPTTPADGSIFVKATVPKEFMGMHANPYWLSRHPSRPKNRDLHRARVLYFSYLCTDINPDAANFVGAPVTEVPEVLKPYFAENDNHAKGSQNCFNCHSKVQPLANFFGLASYGTPYGGGSFDIPQPGGEEDDDAEPFTFTRAPQFLPSEGAFDRPGGIYDGTAFFQAQGSNKGFEGLANVMSKYPKVRQCIADATWAALVGRESPLWEDERAQAVAAFEKNNKPSLARLVTHFLTENQRGKTYFAQGEAAFAAIHPEPDYVCPETLTDEVKTAAANVAKTACKTCHEDQFVDADGKLDVNLYFANGYADDTPENRGKLWHNLNCKVRLQKMPPASAGTPLSKSQRGAFSCLATRTRDTLAAAGQIPETYRDKACPGTPAAPAPTAGPHAIGGTPPPSVGGQTP